MKEYVIEFNKINDKYYVVEKEDKTTHLASGRTRSEAMLNGYKKQAQLNKWFKNVEYEEIIILM